MRIVYLFTFCSLLMMCVSLHAECTQEEAFRRMQVVSIHGNKMQAEMTKMGPSNPSFNQHVQKFRTFSVRLGAGGKILAEKDWNTACAHYESIAKDFNFSLKEGENKVLTLKELEATGGRTPGGECDLTQAAQRMMAMNQAYQKKFTAGELDAEQRKQYSLRTNEIGIEMRKDPSKSCQMMNELKKDMSL